MQKKLILKFDTKDNMLRVDMYRAESIRIKGRCKVPFKENMSHGAIHHTLNDLILGLNDEFKIGFRRNNLKNIKAWIVTNIFKIYIRKDVLDELDAGILKLVSDKCIIIRD